jgi:hypothetical protein
MTEYFRRLDLICYTCEEALNGSHITALGRKYHIGHFSCNACPVVFGATDSYYDHSGVAICYCCYREHAMRCEGCTLPIVEQYFENSRHGVDLTWHSECYMIHPYWNVKTRNASAVIGSSGTSINTQHRDLDTKSVRRSDKSTTAMKSRIWQTLSKSEEQTATLISDMLLHASNGKYNDCVVSAALFLSAVGMLFKAVEAAHDRNLLAPQQSEVAGPRSGRSAGISRDAASRQAKLLCKQCALLMDMFVESSRGHVKIRVNRNCYQLLKDLLIE